MEAKVGVVGNVEGGNGELRVHGGHSGHWIHQHLNGMIEDASIDLYSV